MTEKDKAPFYKELYNKLENELGPIDTIAGLALGTFGGAVICVLYWRHAWKNHWHAKITNGIMRRGSLELFLFYF